MKRIAFVLMMSLAGLAHAQSYYGSRGGNSYYSNGNGGYSGYSSHTGSTWSAQSYGNENSGIDSHGNSWSYDRSSGVYQNYGTGETRVHGQRSGW